VEVLQAADGGELIVVQVRGRHANAGVVVVGEVGIESGSGIPDPAGAVTRREDQARQNADVQCVDELVAGSIVDPDQDRLADGWRTGKGQDKVSIGLMPTARLAGYRLTPTVCALRVREQERKHRNDERKASCIERHHGGVSRSCPSEKYSFEAKVEFVRKPGWTPPSVGHPMSAI